MPFLSIPFEQGSAAVKKNLAEMLKIQGIPALIVIDAKTGEFVSGTAREDVAKAGGDPVKAKAVIENWKSAERKPLAESNVGGGGPDNPIIKFLMFFAKNPMYVFAILYFYKWMQKKMIEWGYGGPGAQVMVEDEPLAEEDSEF